MEENSKNDFNWEDLQQLWKKILHRNTQEWRPGEALEKFIIRSFELSGVDVVSPFPVRLFQNTVEQIDGVLYLGTQAFLLECKDYKKQSSINFEPIAKLKNQLMRRPASTIGCIFSTSGFTEPAILLANLVNPKNILLWERSEIEMCLTRRDMKTGLINKYRKLVELGVADYNIRLVRWVMNVRKRAKFYAEQGKKRRRCPSIYEAF